MTTEEPRAAVIAKKVFRSDTVYYVPPSPDHGRQNHFCTFPAMNAGVPESPKAVEFHTWEARAKGGKRVAVIGLPILDMVLSPLKMALGERVIKENWRIVFAADATIDAYKLLARIKCDGAVVRVMSREMALIARNLPFPVVNISTLIEKPGVTTVCRDDRNVGRLCAEHLLERGFSRFGVIEHPFRGWCFRERKDGFLEAVKAAEPKATVKFHRLSSVPMSEQDEHELKSWFADLGRPAGLFLSDDTGVPTLMDACRAAGFQIPIDFAVISAAGHPDILRDCHPTLTHGREDGEAIVNAACEYLARSMKRSDRDVQMIKVPAVELISGASTDTTSVDDPVLARAIEFMDKFFRDPIQIAEVVTHVNRSRRWLERVFLNAKHVTLHDYLTHKRVKCAQQFMQRMPRPSLEAVAKHCGFGNLPTFNRSFAATTGMSPTKWRQQNAGSSLLKRP